MITGYKAVRRGLVVLAIDEDDLVGVDPELPAAFYARRALVLRGGGVALADSRVRYVKGRYVYPQANERARWRHGPSGIYFWTTRELAQAFAKMIGA